MQIQAAFTQVADVDVAVVWVSKYALQNREQASAYIRDLETSYFGRPVVLAAAGPDTPLLYGCDDQIVEHIANTPLMSLHWVTYEMH